MSARILSEAQTVIVLRALKIAAETHLRDAIEAYHGAKADAQGEHLRLSHEALQLANELETPTHTRAPRGVPSYLRRQGE